MSLADAYDYAAGVMVENMMHEESKEGIGAFIDKRAPDWDKDLSVRRGRRSHRRAAAQVSPAHEPRRLHRPLHRRILAEAKTIAMVGASAADQPAELLRHEVSAGQGLRGHPGQPALAGQEILGRKVYRSLADVPGPIDVVDIFRNSAAALEVVREAIA